MIKEVVFKNFDSENSFWEQFIVIDNSMVPEAFRFSCEGYGGVIIREPAIFNFAEHFLHL